MSRLQGESGISCGSSVHAWLRRSQCQRMRARGWAFKKRRSLAAPTLSVTVFGVFAKATCELGQAMKCVSALCCAQMVWLAMTTNERMNCNRYSHFKRSNSGRIVSPFE